MAANKFATMLHRNTNKITMILIYAVLEWILIGLLLINSLFSYLIIKFADYVGLKPPCLWCSRIDHILDPKKNKNMHKDLLCEAHAKEISLFGYCLNHQKLTESQDLCEDCLSSKPEFDINCSCSCCAVNFERNKAGPQIVIKPSWDVLEYSNKEKGEFISEVNDDDQVEKGVHFYHENRSDEIEKMVSYVNEVLHTLKEEENEESKILKKDQGVQVGFEVEDDLSLELLSQHLEFFIDCSGHRLVPVELIDSATEENFKKVVQQEAKDEDYGSRDIHQENHVLIEEEKEDNDGDDAEQSVNNNGELNVAGFLDSIEMEKDDNSLVVYPNECSESEEADVVQELEDAEQVEKDHLNVHPEKSVNNNEELNFEGFSDSMEMEADDNSVFLYTKECPEREEVDDRSSIQESESDVVRKLEAEESEDKQHSDVHPGSSSNKEQTIEFNDLSIEMNDHVIKTRSLSEELSGIEEEKVPDTPTSLDGLHHLHKKLLLLEKMDSGVEDSMDGSVTSDLEGVITNEQLKSVIKAERKALHALYSELEEERNASEIAANQTMAMINRLQEEKAAMQMEALQYQRMMEEQAEYDQEALQLLNELMVKRVKENEELEKELDVYRKKVVEYETKERLRMFTSGFSSPSYSNAEENDIASSFDLNQEEKNIENGFYNLEDSTADFEGERKSILEHLKVLEEKLLTIDDDEEEEYLHYDGLENGDATNAILRRENVNGKYHPLKSDIIGPVGKNLQPLFDATRNGNGFHGCNNGVVSRSYSLPTFEERSKRRFAVQEELDDLYERLQALEEDREFLKHCISSMNKGDKGMHLLHEILHHLKDLRNVDIHVRNLSDSGIK